MKSLADLGLAPSSTLVVAMVSSNLSHCKGHVSSFSHFSQLYNLTIKVSHVLSISNMFTQQMLRFHSQVISANNALRVIAFR